MRNEWGEPERGANYWASPEVSNSPGGSHTQLPEQLEPGMNVKICKRMDPEAFKFEVPGEVRLSSELSVLSH